MIPQTSTQGRLKVSANYIMHDLVVYLDLRRKHEGLITLTELPREIERALSNPGRITQSFLETASVQFEPLYDYLMPKRGEWLRMSYGQAMSTIRFLKEIN